MIFLSVYVLFFDRQPSIILAGTSSENYPMYWKEPYSRGNSIPLAMGKELLSR